MSICTCCYYQNKCLYLFYSIHSLTYHLSDVSVKISEICSLDRDKLPEEDYSLKYKKNSFLLLQKVVFNSKFVFFQSFLTVPWFYRQDSIVTLLSVRFLLKVGADILV